VVRGSVVSIQTIIMHRLTITQTKWRLLTVFSFLLCCAHLQAQTVNPLITHYVNHSATGSNNGTSWQNAYTNLQDALNAAAVSDDIWVAAGTYYPTKHFDLSASGDARAKSFYMKKNLQIYGGFVGTETLLSQRAATTNVTILSGDIGTLNDSTDNCYHVFITKNLTAATVIDGFTVRNGSATDGNYGTLSYGVFSFDNGSGGGFYNYNSSPTLTNLTVSNNSAYFHGGGFCNMNSSPTLTDVIVNSNNAQYGGGFYNDNSSPTLTNVTVSNSVSYSGGGFFNTNSSPTLTNVTVSDNTANYGGGGFYNNNSLPTLTDVIVSNNTATGSSMGGGNGGGFFNEYASPTLINVIVSNNTANYGGGFYNGNSSFMLTDVTVSGNNAQFGGGFYNDNSLPTLTNVTVSNNLANQFGGGFYNIFSSFTLTDVTVSNNTATYEGGGFYNGISSLTLTNVTVNNNAANDGGGFYNDNSSLTLTDVTVSSNNAQEDGGGFYNYYSSLTLINSTVSNNTANYGGGFSNDNSSPTLTNVIVSNNLANLKGGGFLNINSSPTLTNVIVSNNLATFEGGGFYNYYSSPIFTNVTVSNNTATYGGGIYNDFYSSPIINNAIIWDNNGNNEVYNYDNSTPTFSYSIVKNSGGSLAWNGIYGTDGGNNLDIDPLFTDAANGDFTLQAASPAINLGDDAAWTATGLTIDLAGNARPVGIVDMGAYKNQAVLPVEMLYFTGEALENGNFLTWATASEENNAGFEVQKSTDARTFEKIGFVVGNGTTYEQQTYNFLDTKSFQNLTGLNTVYYRLKQLDFDDKFEYSNIVSISNQNTAATSLLLYPNPAISSNLTIENGEGTAVLFNALGQPLRQFNINNSNYLLNVNELPQGIYTLQIRRTDGTTVVQQFVK
jgi:hypothetical protein